MKIHLFDKWYLTGEARCWVIGQLRTDKDGREYVKADSFYSDLDSALSKAVEIKARMTSEATELRQLLVEMRSDRARLEKSVEDTLSGTVQDAG